MPDQAPGYCSAYILNGLFEKLEHGKMGEDIVVLFMILLLSFLLSYAN